MSGKKSFLLRMNPELYELMEKWAADEFRSVNGHIEYLLRDAAMRSGRWSKKEVASKIKGQEGSNDASEK